MERMTYDFMDVTKGIWFQRLPGSPKFYKESALYRHVCRLLNSAGWNVVKQVPDKDGHMFGAPYYIREKRRKWCLYDNYYAIRCLHEAFNAGEKVYLFYFDMKN